MSGFLTKQQVNEWLLLIGSRGQTTHKPGIPGLLMSICGLGFFYGVAMGTFSGVATDRLLQMFYSGVKVPMLLAITFLMSLPSYFVLNTLAGLRDDFGDVIQALLKTQVALTLSLASLAPLTILWYLSVPDYNSAILLNAMMFGVSSISAQFLLWRSYQSLITRNKRHRWLLPFWLVVYAFVGIQMGWVLRPFIGDPQLPTQFFRPDSWSNAYLVVINLVLSIFR